MTAERLARLRQLAGQDLAAQTMTPAGPGTVADMLTLRVMDSWSHEQDIRRAVGRPGHVRARPSKRLWPISPASCPTWSASGPPRRKGQGGLPHRRPARWRSR